MDIIDGDTIDVEMGGRVYRVRYIGIDAPERGTYYYQEATDANAALVEGQEVILVKDVSETDRFGRLLRYVYLLDGTFVNAELVRRGFAQVATFPPDVRHQELYLQLQQEARDAGSGLWAASVVAAVTPTWTPAPLPTWTPAPLATWAVVPPTVAAPPTEVAPPTEPPPPPPDAPVCDCSGNIYDCSSFATHSAAQACFAYCWQVAGRDVHRLDGDGDGIACESLP